MAEGKKIFKQCLDSNYQLIMKANSTAVKIEGPSELDLYTFYGIRSRLEQKNRSRSILQFLGFKGKDDTLYLEISDGNIKENVAPCATVRQQLELTPLQTNDIIEAEIVFHKQTLMIILGYKIVYSGVNDIIGAPISFEKFIANQLSNKAGKISIPKKFWVKLEDGIEDDISDASDDNEQIDNDIRDLNLLEKKFDARQLYTPIKLITSKSNSWIMRARCIEKNPIRNYSRGFRDHKLEDGKILKVIFEDESGRIQATLFNKEVERYERAITEGTVYTIYGAGVKDSGKFNLTSNPFELSFTTTTKLEKSPGDHPTIPFNVFNLRKIECLRTEEIGVDVDIIAVIESIDGPRIIQTKDKREIIKTSLTLVDDSNHRIDCVIWGNIQNLGNLILGDIIFFRHLKLREFKGSRNLSSCFQTRIDLFSTNIQGYEQLNSWLNEYKLEHCPSQIVNVSQASATSFGNRIFRTITEIQEESKILLHEPEKRLFFDAEVVLTNIGRRMTYDACPNQSCLKKLIQQDLGDWHCEKCALNYPAPFVRYIGCVKICDSTGEIYTTVNREDVGIALLGGRSAEKFKQDSDPLEIYEFMEWANQFQLKYYQVKLMAKHHHYNGQDSVRFTILNVVGEESVDIKQRNKIMVDTLKNCIQSMKEKEIQTLRLSTSKNEIANENITNDDSETKMEPESAQFSWEGISIIDDKTIPIFFEKMEISWPELIITGSGSDHNTQFTLSGRLDKTGVVKIIRTSDRTGEATIYTGEFSDSAISGSVFRDSLKIGIFELKLSSPTTKLLDGCSSAAQIVSKSDKIFGFGKSNSGSVYLIYSNPTSESEILHCVLSSHPRVSSLKL